MLFLKHALITYLGLGAIIANVALFMEWPNLVRDFKIYKERYILKGLAQYLSLYITWFFQCVLWVIKG